MKTFGFAIIFTLCTFLLRAQDSLSIINLGENINSEYDEAFPLISPDGQSLYFIRSDHPKNTFGTNLSQDIWYSRFDKSKDEWKSAVRMDFPFNQQRFNSIMGITPDGHTMMIKGAYKKGTYKSRGLSFSHKTRRGWTLPEKLNIKNYEKMSKGKYEGAYLCGDGKTVIINMSETPDDPNCDLYVSFMQPNGNWTQVMKLSSRINTKYNEASPFLAADGVTLYFASNKPGGYGDFDIYKTKRLDDTWTNWSEPINLGPQINSSGREAYYTIAASGEYAFMVSNVNSIGKSDIVMIKLTESAKPDPVVLVTGKVLNAKTNEPVDAFVSYEILPEGFEAGQAISDPEDGSYNIVLPYGKKYGFSAVAEGYLPVSEYIDLSAFSTYQEVNRNLYLVPVEEGQTIRMNNIFFETGSANLREESFPELDRVARFLLNNKKINIEIAGHTDNVGGEELNMQLSSERAAAVRTYLLSKGVHADKITSKGYGESKPVADNESEEGRAENRRVEFTILRK